MISMVNNAGICIEARNPAVLHLTDEATWDTTMRVNAKSVFLGCKYALTQMLAQEPHAEGDRGWIVNISSIMGMIAGTENREFTTSRVQYGWYLTPHSILLRIQGCCQSAHETGRFGLCSAWDPC